ncbi:protein LEAD-SENSITIVE 1 [Cryptomeria japonica]|uniref:protein LEAD-SENSITIVE 1 n=1 Tax=Cryptomeria japonica TaxID=3369 RepID=UPI0027DA55FF|nr:protein LEAD-SENSITIVE 1 [Cryptomeria japonica]
MGLFSNKISREDLKPGDHIYSWRCAYVYAHHGIYIGDNQVIHFIRGRDEEVAGDAMLNILLLSSGSSQNSNECQKCNFQQNNSGVISSCLDCFLAGGNLYRFEYGVQSALFVAKARGGTCTLAETDFTETVIHRAKYLLENGFGCYNIFKNNCEDFSIYCKTGLLVVNRSGVGPSGQAASVIGVFTAVFSSPLRFLITSTAALSTIAGGFYCLSRYATDIGIRRDVARVPVESLMVRVSLSDPQTIASIAAGPQTH